MDKFKINDFIITNKPSFLQFQIVGITKSDYELMSRLHSSRFYHPKKNVDDICELDKSAIFDNYVKDIINE